MSEPICTPGAFEGGRITAELPFARITELVMDRRIVILKGAFGAELERLAALRSAVFEWARQTEPLAEPNPEENCHCMQAGVSRLQKTPHIYHSYNFNRISRLPPALAAQLLRYFKPLCDFQNAVTGNAARLEGFEDGPTLHPQLIQYPLGGGIFGRHLHPLNPQRIGLIAALSRRGADYGRGGACFDVGGEVVDIEPYHDMGDIALFRFDLPHWVNPSDLRDKFDWDSDRGRWTMVLPYH